LALAFLASFLAAGAGAGVASLVAGAAVVAGY